MRVVIPAACLLALAGFVAWLPPSPAGVKTGTELFSGTWVVKDGAYKGKPYTDKVGTKFTFGGDGVTVTEKSGETKKGFFRVETGFMPQRVNLVFGAGGKERMFGVYEFVGDVLRLCYGTQPADRPADTRTEPTKEWTLLILVRLSQ